MKKEKNVKRKKDFQIMVTPLALALFLTAILCATAVAQEKTAPAVQQTSPSSSAERKGDAVFKVPKGYMAMDKSEIGPMLMLNPKQGETTQALRLRLRDLAANMFFHENTAGINWDVKQLQSHPDDGDGKADISTARQGEMEVQVVTYERTTGVRPFVYGYFAMRHLSHKSDDARFIDESGGGVKEFDQLWQSLSK